jgi:diguanylate cyclase (GGDEF)-like protein/PAS domain S-box-containing protein
MLRNGSQDKRTVGSRKKAANHPYRKIPDQERVYRIVADYSHDWEYLLDEKRQVLYTSPSCSRIAGYSPEQILSDSSLLETMIHPGDRPVVARHFRQEALPGVPTTIVFRIINSSGQELWIEHICKPLFDEDGTYIGRRVSNRDVTERIEIEESLKHRQAFESLIASISTRFADLPLTAIDDAINYALEEVGTFADVDRSYVFLLSEDRESIQNTHEWCAPYVTPQIGQLRRLPLDSLPWFAERILRHEVVAVPDVTELPAGAEAEKEEFMRGSIQSFVVVPMLLQGSLVGFLGFDAVHRKKTWSESVTSLLKMAGEVFVNALSRKWAEYRLYKREREYRDIFENAVEGIFQSTPDGRFRKVNPAFAAMLGYSDPSEMIETYRDIAGQYYVDPADRDRYTKLLAACGSVEGFETQVYRRDGTRIWVSSNTRTVFDEKGRLLYYEGTIENIDERKRSEELFTILANHSPVAVYIIQEGRFVYVNSFFEENTGYEAKDLIGTSPFNLVPAGERESLRENAIAMLKRRGNTPYESTVIDRSGNLHWILETVTPISYLGRRAVLGTFTDISDRKKAETLLRESEERFRILTELSLVGVYLVQDDLFRYVNPAFARIHGYEDHEIMGKLGPVDMALPRHRDAVLNDLRRRVEGTATSACFDFDILRKDGTVRTVEVHGVRADYDGKPAVLGTLIDVTERKQMEEGLRVLSVRDELTGLYNRRGFVTLAEQQIRVAGRAKKDMTLFFLDVDSLKQINDTFGHGAGDQVLKEFGEVLRRTFRGSDIIGRVGGDEFAVLVTNSEAPGNTTLTSRLNRNIASRNNRPEGPCPFSVSIGSANYDPREPASLDRLLSQADSMMYSEKRGKTQAV